MKEHENTAADPKDRLDRNIHRDLGKLGWRTPQSDAEVRAAEQDLEATPGEVPERLQRVDLGPVQGDAPRDGLLSKYLPDDGRGLEAEQQPETGRSSLDLDR
jgi:hypothetical protein